MVPELPLGSPSQVLLSTEGKEWRISPDQATPGVNLQTAEHRQTSADSSSTYTYSKSAEFYPEPDRGMCTYLFFYRKEGREERGQINRVWRDAFRF